MTTRSRREVLQLAAGATLAACVGGSPASAKQGAGAPAKESPVTTMQPVLFVSHGSPMAAVEQNAYSAALRAFGESLVRPRAIVVVSAHWQTRGGILVTAMDAPETIHDFGGFPRELYSIRYGAPGAPALAEEVVTRLREAGFVAQAEKRRGLDHGTWVPLLHVAPDAKIPVVQVSLAHPRTPDELLKLGDALAALRRDNVLLIGSGGLIHNFDLVDWSGTAEPPAWTGEFDAWVLDRVKGREFTKLAEYRSGTKYGVTAAPTPEHFDPLFFVAGAAASSDALVSVYDGYQLGTMSLRTFALKTA